MTVDYDDLNQMMQQVCPLFCTRKLQWNKRMHVCTLVHHHPKKTVFDCLLINVIETWDLHVSGTMTLFTTSLYFCDIFFSYVIIKYGATFVYLFVAFHGLHADTLHYTN